MTFIEAALEILERNGAPLHARIIAERAVKAELLSHVGKTPLKTMSNRISASVAKGNGPFVRVKPGVFGLTAWGEAQKAPKKEVPPPKEVPSPSEVPKPGQKSASGDRSGEGTQKGRERNGSHQGRRTEKDRDRGRDRDRTRARDQDRDRNKNKNREGGRRRGHKEGRQDRDRNSSPAAAGDNGNGTGTSGEGGAGSNVGNGETGARWDFRSPGSDVVERVWNLLKKQNGHMVIGEILHQLRLPKGMAGAVEALLEAEGQARTLQGLAPRFVRHKNGFGLWEREVPSDLVAAELQIEQGRSQLMEQAVRQVARKVRQLSTELLAPVVMAWLFRQGAVAVEPVRGGGPLEIRLRVTGLAGAKSEVTAVLIRRQTGNGALAGEVVTLLRGALHQYGATRGLVVTTGEISGAALAESKISNGPAVSVMDGKDLATALVQVGIGVSRRIVEVVSFDESSF